MCGLEVLSLQCKHLVTLASALQETGCASFGVVRVQRVTRLGRVKAKQQIEQWVVSGLVVPVKGQSERYQIEIVER